MRRVLFAVIAALAVLLAVSASAHADCDPEDAGLRVQRLLRPPDAGRSATTRPGVCLPPPCVALDRLHEPDVPDPRHEPEPIPVRGVHLRRGLPRRARVRRDEPHVRQSPPHPGRERRHRRSGRRGRRVRGRDDPRGREPARRCGGLFSAGRSRERPGPGERRRAAGRGSAGGGGGTASSRRRRARRLLRRGCRWRSCCCSWRAKGETTARLSIVAPPSANSRQGAGALIVRINPPVVVQ